MLDVPQFAVKSRDVVGLHISQPAHAAVLRIDENSQIQALDRTQKRFKELWALSCHVFMEAAKASSVATSLNEFISIRIPSSARV
jgi:hypothetical protein